MALEKQLGSDAHLKLCAARQLIEERIAGEAEIVVVAAAAAARVSKQARALSDLARG